MNELEVIITHDVFFVIHFDVKFSIFPNTQKTLPNHSIAKRFGQKQKIY